ncbi:DUF4118 domain-containing protein [Dictyobacter kobayashii]|uniref:Sensor protein KdpD transmembrane domain-containing protein n=1 Tax=Dictyobacter kobayashii TaxID=2014872 RepID=A0A402AWE5_9CHLR|nr:DUF4118 domain-containing protein [Dictyobacter kobayashii]GCE23460.1 hypothetical protein KDK_72600 [Dictyobacter kobayashii]
MQNVESIPQLRGRKPVSWQGILWESVFGFFGTLGVTALIAAFHLYPRIPNISIIYLLVILALASIFGRYASLLASFVAFFSFDFFLVPPLYLFTINRWEEWVALFVFLITALLTSQLTIVLRQRSALARQRESEARILYELIRLTNSHESLDDQLEIVALAVTRVFASWGVSHCALLLPDEQGALKQLMTSGPGGFELDYEERLLAVTSMLQGRMMERRQTSQPYKQDADLNIRYYQGVPPISTLRLIPLKADDRSFGVLCLRITNPAPWFANQESMDEDLMRAGSQVSFFWTFCEQVSSLLERVHLRSVVYHVD